ncbi:hypothetical protein A1F94_010608 [Pyrenophora tritici-repentis]|nr:hypothetical protein A1F94_010608 [Pyrenophora tritici-repentis]
MTWPVTVGDGATVMEDSPGTEPLLAEPTPSPIKYTFIDPKDPEGFLKRCSGCVEKDEFTLQRCHWQKDAPEYSPHLPSYMQRPSRPTQPRGVVPVQTPQRREMRTAFFAGRRRRTLSFVTNTKVTPVRPVTCSSSCHLSCVTRFTATYCLPNPSGPPPLRTIRKAPMKLVRPVKGSSQFIGSLIFTSRNLAITAKRQHPNVSFLRD